MGRSQKSLTGTSLSLTSTLRHWDHLRKQEREAVRLAPALQLPPSVIRAFLEQLVCPWCERGPFKMPAAHIVKVHSIDRFTLYDWAELSQTEKAVDSNLRAKMSTKAKDRGLGTQMVDRRPPSATRRSTARSRMAAVEGRERLAKLQVVKHEAAQVTRACRMCGQEFIDKASGKRTTCGDQACRSESHRRAALRAQVTLAAKYSDPAARKATSDKISASKGGGQGFNCKVCGGHVEAERWTNRVTCSRECLIEDRRQVALTANVAKRPDVRAKISAGAKVRVWDRDRDSGGRFS